MDSEFSKVKNIKECMETATVDANGEEEAAMGWQCCFEEVFEGVKKVKIFDEPVELVEFSLSQNSLVAICQKGKKKAKVTLDSIGLIKPTKIQSLWLKAWLAWEGKGN